MWPRSQIRWPRTSGPVLTACLVFIFIKLTSSISSGLTFCNVVGIFGLIVVFTFFLFLTLGRNSAGNLDQSVNKTMHSDVEVPLELKRQII